MPQNLRRILTAVSLCTLLAACGQSPTTQRTELNAGSRLRVGEAAERSGDNDTEVSMYAAAAEAAPDDSSVQVRAAITRGRPAIPRLP